MSGKFLNNETVVLTVISLAIGIGLFWYSHESSSIQISYRQTPEMGDFIVISFPIPVSKEKALKSFSIAPAVVGEWQWSEERRELLFVPTVGLDPDKSYTVKIKPPSLFAQLTSGTDQKTFQPKNLPVKFNARLPGNPTIYYITEAGLKRPISPEVFSSYPDNSEENIQTIDKETLDLYPDNLLIHLSSGSPVYKLENGIKKHVPKVEVFNALGFDWNSIALVNQLELDSYPEGEPLTIGKWPSVETAANPNSAKGKMIDVDLTAMKLTMWEDGKIVGEVPVAGQGNPKTSPTRKGFFTILSKEENHLSSISRVWMPWSMRYSGGYFIHGWPYWPNGAKLTSKYSGGCVRLFDNDVQKVFEFAEIGTAIIIK